jgi:hypothetical protein
VVLDEVQALPADEQVLEHGGHGRAADAMARSRPGGARRGDDVSAPPWRRRWAFSSSRTAATIVAVGLSSRAVSVMRTGGVVAVGRDDDRPRLLDARLAQDVVDAASPATARGPRPRPARGLGRSSMTDDLAEVDAAGLELVDGGAALGPVAADDGVVVQGLPPAGER